MASLVVNSAGFTIWSQHWRLDLSRTFPLTSNVENGSYSNSIIFNIHQNRKDLRIFITNEHLCLTVTALLSEKQLQNNLTLCTRESLYWICLTGILSMPINVVCLHFCGRKCCFAGPNPYWCLRCIICFKNDHNTVLNCIEQCREVTSSFISKR